jgi:hypothetical protein
MAQSNNYIEIFFNGKYRVGKGLATRYNLDHTALDSEETIGEIVQSSTAMNEVTTSQTAMGAVIASQTAMDSVTASQTADQIYHNSNLYGDALASVGATGASGVGDVDAVAASQTAMDSVAASQTAMDAMIASQTALDTVTTSQTAMDSVAASQTAMDTVSVSTATLDAIWSSEIGSEGFWTYGDPTPPRSFTAGGDSWNLDFSVVNNTTALQLSGGGNGSSYATERYIAFSFDLSSVSTLTITTSASLGGSNSTIQVWVGNDNIFSTGSHSDTKRTLDVSAYSGTTKIEFGGNLAAEYGPDEHTWKELRLD